jgi:hypothetical protein
MEILFNEAMLIEWTQHLGVGHYERSNNRLDYANGYKPSLCWIYRKEFTLPGDVQDLKSAVNFLPIYPNPKIKTKKTHKPQLV